VQFQEGSSLSQAHEIMFKRFVGVFCRECGKFIKITWYETPHSRHSGTDLTLDGSVFDCPDGHRDAYYSADVIHSASEDGVEPLNTKR